MGVPYTDEMIANSVTGKALYRVEHEPAPVRWSQSADGRRDEDAAPRRRPVSSSESR